MTDSATNNHLSPEQETEFYYQAVGTVEGILQQQEDHWSLTIGQQSFWAWVDRKRSFFKRIEFGAMQRFRVYPLYRHRYGLGFRIINLLPSDEPLGLTLRGCWSVSKFDAEVCQLMVHRNQRRNSWDQGKSLYLPLKWDNAPDPDGQFWIVSAQLQETDLVVTEAQGPFPPPLNWFQKEQQSAQSQDLDTAQYDQAQKSSKSQAYISKKKSQSTSGKPPSPSVEASQVQAPLTVQEIRSMAIPAKIQVTCKISEMPPHRDVEGLTEFFLADGDRILTVRLKPKQFKRLTSHDYDQWVAAVTGSLGPATQTGFELINASIQVFEKKAKAAEEKPGKATSKAKDHAAGGASKRDQGSSAKATERVDKPPKKHRLVDSVRFG